MWWYEPSCSSNQNWTVISKTNPRMGILKDAPSIKMYKSIDGCTVVIQNVQIMNRGQYHQFPLVWTLSKNQETWRHLLVALRCRTKSRPRKTSRNHHTDGHIFIYFSANRWRGNCSSINSRVGWGTELRLIRLNRRFRDVRLGHLIVYSYRSLDENFWTTCVFPFCD